MPIDPRLAALIAAADSLAETAAAQRRHAADRTAVGRILAATLELMGRGPEIRIAEVVRAAGVSNDAFYRAFRGKAELLAAVTDQAQHRLVGHVAEELGAAPDHPVERVRVCVRAVLDQADPKTAATTRAVLRHTSRPDGTLLGCRLADLLAGPLAALGSPTPAADALAAAGALLSALEQHLWAGTTPTAADADHLLGYLLRASRP